MKKLLSLSLSLVMLAALATGCGKDPAPKENPSDPSGAQGSSPRVLTMGISGTPNLDPAVAASSSEMIVMVNLYDTLVYPGTTGVEGRIAESWESAPDGMSHTFHLKKGIKFHNGEELKASDVVFSMNRLLAIGEGNAYLYIDYVDSVTAPDDYTVVFNMKIPFGPFVDSLIRLSILSEKEVMANLQDGIYKEFKDYGKNYLLTHDAGSGAYKAKELVQQDYFYAEKNPDWFVGWTNPKAPDGFKMMAITEATTVRTMINNGTLDLTDQWQSPENLDAMSKLDGIKIASYSTYLMDNMYLNNTLPPMDDVNFRRAMSCLIDYDTVCKTILVDSVKASGPVANGILGHTPIEGYSFNIEKAKEYLSKSKYANNLGDYSVEILCNSDVVALEKVALMIQAAAQQVGVKVEISKAPWVSIIDRVGSSATTPHMMAITSTPKYNEAGSYLEARYHSKNQGTWEQGEWLGDKKLDGMIEAALKTGDEKERFAKYAEIEKYIVNDL
ncbi:MAG: ABC transporter substrate-binding protein, partial [Oscillospiraceae bacterium]